MSARDRSEVDAASTEATAAPASTRPASGGAGAARTARPRIRMLALLGSEIATLFRRRRTIAMLGALALVPILIGVAVRVTSASDPGRGPAFLGLITENGLFVSFTALVVSIPLFLPMTVGVVAGDTIAGEASLGTLRYLLVAPASRIRLLIVKYVGAAVFSVAAAATLVLVGAGIGALLFPIRDVTLLSGETIGPGEFALRCALLVGYVVMSLLGFSAIGLFISTLTSVPVGAMAATIVLAAGSQILDALPQLSAIHPLLFSHHWLDFGDLLRAPIEWDSYGANAVLQACYIAIFGAAAVVRLGTKDVLS